MAKTIPPRMEAFSQAYVRSGNATGAHREAGYAPRMQDKTRWEEASRLLKNPKVAARISEIRAEVGAAARVTLEGHVAELLWLREMAALNGKYSAAVQAEMARGKVHGLYIERVVGTLELTEKPDLSALSPDELEQLEALMAKARVSGAPALS